MGLVVTVSRGISKADDPRQAANYLNSKINQVRKTLLQGGTRLSNQVDRSLKILGIELLKSGCVKFGEFTLKSGLHSPIYIDLRRLVGYPGLLKRVAEEYLVTLRGLNFDRMAGIPYAGLPIATAISLQGGYPLVYPRKETKTYGTRAEIEGVFSAGERVVLIDDLATTGGSKFEAIDLLNTVGLAVKDVLVLIDRQSGAAEDLAKSGYRMHSVFTLTQLLNYWKTADLISMDQVDAVQKFISTTGLSTAN